MREEAKAVYINMMTLEDTEKQRGRGEQRGGGPVVITVDFLLLMAVYISNTPEMRAFLKPQSSERVCWPKSLLDGVFRHSKRRK